MSVRATCTAEGFDRLKSFGYRLRLGTVRRLSGNWKSPSKAHFRARSKIAHARDSNEAEVT